MGCWRSLIPDCDEFNPSRSGIGIRPSHTAIRQILDLTSCPGTPKKSRRFMIRTKFPNIEIIFGAESASMFNSLSDGIDKPSCPGAFSQPSEREEPETIADPSNS